MGFKCKRCGSQENQQVLKSWVVRGKGNKGFECFIVKCGNCGRIYRTTKPLSEG